MSNEADNLEKGNGAPLSQTQTSKNDISKAQSNTNGDCETITDVKAAITADLDEAQLFLHEHGIPNARLEELMGDEDRLKKLRKKVDWHLMPLLCGTYLLQYVDKQALGYSAVFDLFDSTGMTSDQYSWMASIFYFAYLVAEWPAAYVAQHYPTGKVVAAFVLSWGTILLCTAAAQNFAGLAVCRFLLGVFEAVITPAFMLIVSQWFTRDKQPARAGLFYCFNGVGSMFGGVLFYGVGQAKGWDVWRIIYVLCGGLRLPGGFFSGSSCQITSSLLDASQLKSVLCSLHRTLAAVAVSSTERSRRTRLRKSFSTLRSGCSSGMSCSMRSSMVVLPTSRSS